MCNQVKFMKFISVVLFMMYINHSLILYELFINVILMESMADLLLSCTSSLVQAAWDLKVVGLFVFFFFLTSWAIFRQGNAH